MNDLVNNRELNTVAIIYFAVAFVLLLSAIFQFYPFVIVLKLAIIPILMILYFFSSRKKNKLYFIALLFLFLTNMFFLETAQENMFYGENMHIVYLFLIIIIAKRSLEKPNFLPLILAIIPFLSVFAYLIVLTEELLSVNLYPSIINVLLMSFLGGFSLVNYIFNDNKKNTFLLISSILFTAQIFIFVIQKYYYSNEVFKIINVIVYVISHFWFYRFMILSEEGYNKKKKLK